MSMQLSGSTVRRWAVLGLLCFFTTPAFANSITIGTLTFMSYGTPGNPMKSLMALQLNTTGMTFDAYLPSLQYSLVFDAQVFGWTGIVSTIPPTYMLIDPPHYCPCESVVFTMTLAQLGPFRLANGQLFNPVTTVTVTMLPPPGQTYLQPGQAADIVLNSVPSPVPEPASLLLVGSGLIGISAARWRKWKG